MTKPEPLLKQVYLSRRDPAQTADLRRAAAVRRLRQKFAAMHQVRNQATQLLALAEQALDAGEQIVGNASVNRFDSIDVA
jgi:hypothetical protein